MNRIHILSIRKNTDPSVRELETGFLRRLAGPFVTTITDIRPRYSDSLPAAQITTEEASAFEARIPAGARRVAMDEGGKALSSSEFASFIRTRLDDPSGKPVYFLIGSAYGLPGTVKASAQWTLTLSRMTFNHEIARLVLIEQIYRAQEILRGGKYHR